MGVVAGECEKLVEEKEKEDDKFCVFVCDLVG